MWPQRVDRFPANSVTIYLPASCSFLFALSDTFHYGRCCPSWPPSPTLPLMSCPCLPAACSVGVNASCFALCMPSPADEDVAGRAKRWATDGSGAWHLVVFENGISACNFYIGRLPPHYVSVAAVRHFFFIHLIFFCFQHFSPLFCIPVAKCIQFNASFSFRFRSLFIFVWLFFNEPPCWLKVLAYKNFQVCH